MAHLRVRDDAEAVLSTCRPGQVAIVWYSDDTVYHERILVWKVDATTWHVLTPDGDVYAEDWSGRGSDGPVSFKLKGTDFRYYSRVSKPVYRFSEFPSDNEFRQHVETALKDLGEFGNVPSWRPSKVVDMKGNECDAVAYLGRLLVPRRIYGRGTVQEPHLPEADARPNRGIPSAPDGQMWVNSSLQRSTPVGKEINQGLDEGLLLNSTTGAVWR